MADQPTEARLALYRKLSTEHLQTLLRSDLDGPPLDEATVDSILTVLAERRRTPADTSAAWQDFSAKTISSAWKMAPPSQRCWKIAFPAARVTSRSQFGAPSAIRCQRCSAP